MKVQEIFYSSRFEKVFKKLPRDIQEVAVKQEATFRKNPLHPSLRLHKLRGKLDGHWSISISMQYRIIFLVLENGDILFISVGTHSIYE